MIISYYMQLPLLCDITNICILGMEEGRFCLRVIITVNLRNTMQMKIYINFKLTDTMPIYLYGIFKSMLGTPLGRLTTLEGRRRACACPGRCQSTSQSEASLL